MRRALWTALLCGSCGASNDLDQDEDSGLPRCSTLRSETITVVTDDEGGFEVSVDVRPGEHSFQLTMSDPELDTYPFVVSMDAPNGTTVVEWESWYEDERMLSSGLLPTGYVGVFDWPVREQDGPLTGGSWTVRGMAVSDWNGQPRDDQTLELTTYVKGGGRLADGCLDVRVILVDDTPDDAHVLESIQIAVSQMVDIFADQGIALDIVYEETQLGDDLPSPGEGSQEYAEMHALGEEHELVMVVGEWLENSDQGVLGESGGAPGTLVNSPHSVVAISWLMQSGASGKFNDEEISYLSETMAHELGHYLGLHHPVNFDSNGDAEWLDGIDDTPTCPDFDSCFIQLGENLMFPYSLCAYTNSCEHQDDVTEDQRGVLLRYTGTL